MKKQYIVPQAEIVNVRLQNSVLDKIGTGGWSDGGVGGDNPEYADAKENNLVEEEEILPTQPNLWDDEEE